MDLLHPRPEIDLVIGPASLIGGVQVEDRMDRAVAQHLVVIADLVRGGRSAGPRAGRELIARSVPLGRRLVEGEMLLPPWTVLPSTAFRLILSSPGRKSMNVSRTGPFLICDSVVNTRVSTPAAPIKLAVGAAAVTTSAPEAPITFSKCLIVSAVPPTAIPALLLCRSMDRSVVSCEKSIVSVPPPPSYANISRAGPRG
jgi:hypothetical protein